METAVVDLGAERIVDRGRVVLNNTPYEHDAMMTLNGQTVQLRYDPMALDKILIFHEGAYLCEAETVEYSSMKDMTLAKRKIVEKRRKRKRFADR